MLCHLFISNYALIHELDIDFSEGFSVITGETGAGKSILIGALSLILGERADTAVLKDAGKKCTVEGVFNIKDYGLEDFFLLHDLEYDEQTILRREITTNGKSRAFVNDTPVNLYILKQLGGKLINIHSQYQTLIINEADFQLTVIDNYGHLLEKVDIYRMEFIKYIELKQELNNLIKEEKRSKADEDYYNFLYTELDQAHLVDGEQEEIQKELEILTHAEDIKTSLSQITSSLQTSDDNVLAKIAEIRNIANRLSKFHDGIKTLSQRLESTLIELKDIARELEGIEQQVFINPEMISKYSSRIDMIYHLEHKHRVDSIAQLIELKNNFSDKINQIASFETQISELEKEVARREDLLRKISGEISNARRHVIPEIESEFVKILSSVGMPEAQFRIEMSSANELGKDGADKVSFLFNANRGGDLREISSVASGGERSRLMLGIKSMIARKNLLPTIIFDEIDMGVSGEIAGKVANILQKMAQEMQVIVITHLPQIAGKSKEHYLVYKYSDKDATHSAVRKLTKEERILEIAKLLSNENISESAIQTAKELLKGPVR
ncbi:MAG: DNA repair protein RecN [Bacteroidetes bacterium]|nr:DNA repair protein RecN [Bacteroidota bacterium]